MPPESETISYCGVKFWNGSLDVLIETLEREGGYMVVPAAPAMCDMPVDRYYATALVEANFAVIDSGYVAILMMLENLRLVNRISGLRFLQRFLDPASPAQIHRKKVLWVMPSSNEKELLASYLKNSGFADDLQRYYLAPFYRTSKDFQDQILVDQISLFRPDWVILCIGGGKQEKLANCLCKRFGNSIRVVCTGAAISFLTGGQANIPTWADRMFLGWFFRMLKNPKLFGKRYLSALKLPLVVHRIRRGQNSLMN